MLRKHTKFQASSQSIVFQLYGVGHRMFSGCFLSFLFQKSFTNFVSLITEITFPTVGAFTTVFRISLITRKLPTAVCSVWEFCTRDNFRKWKAFHSIPIEDLSFSSGIKSSYLKCLLRSATDDGHLSFIAKLSQKITGSYRWNKSEFEVRYDERQYGE